MVIPSVLSILKRYILSMTLSDHTGKAWVTVFNNDAEPLLKGRTADELNELKQEGQVSL